MAWETLFGGPITFNMLYPGKVIVFVQGQQGYGVGASFPSPWQLRVLLNGVVVRSSGGGGFGTENPAVFKPIFGVAAGQHTMHFQWYGKDNTMLFTQISGFIDRRYA